MKKTTIITIFAIILTLALSVCINAAEETITISNVSGNYYYAVISTDAGQAYCVEMSKPHPTAGTVYTESGSFMSGMDEVLVAINLLSDGSEDFAIGAQFAIWEITEGFSMKDACASMANATAANHCSAIIDKAANLGDIEYEVSYNFYSADGFQTIMIPTMINIVESIPEPVYYTVSYEYTGVVPANAPEVPASAQYEAGSYVSIANDVYVDGYEFSGWDTNDFIMPEHDVVIRGSFEEVIPEPVLYTVSYEYTGVVPANAPEVPASAQYEAGSYVSIANDVYVDGYEFSGWDTNDFIMPEHDVVIRGSFEEIVVETEPVETEPVETEPVETEPVETEPVETEPVETEPVETEPVETEPVETEPVETEPVETEPVETEPVETEPVETEPVETEPVETEPVETEPVETEPVETEPVETEPEVEPVFEPEEDPIEPDDLGFEFETAPQTGDNNYMFIVLMVVSAIGIAFASKKQKN